MDRAFPFFLQQGTLFPSVCRFESLSPAFHASQTTALQTSSTFHPVGINPKPSSCGCSIKPWKWFPLAELHTPSVRVARGCMCSEKSVWEVAWLIRAYSVRVFISPSLRFHFRYYYRPPFHPEILPQPHIYYEDSCTTEFHFLFRFIFTTDL